MSFPRYPTYKDSGQDWIGALPAHWCIHPVKRLFGIVGGSTPASDTPAFWDGDVPWVTPADLSKLGQLEISESQRSITVAGVASCSTTVSPAGSIILSTRAPIGSLAISIRPMCTNQGCKTLVPKDHVVVRYFGYLFGIAKEPLNLRGKGTTFLELSADELGRFPVPAPPLDEQRAIAAFLDRETAKIDALVAEQRRLLDILREKRQAVISHAVTKGLNPDTPKKYSGVEWLGEVPAHWTIGRVKTWLRTTSGGTPNTAQQELYYTSEDAGVPWIRTTDLVNGPVSVAEVFITQRALQDTACTVLPTGTVLVAMYGGDGTVGKNGMLTFPAAINQAVCGLLPSEDFNTEFLLRYMQFYRPYWMIGAESSRKDPNISQELVRECPILHPPRVEQDAIAKWINAEVGRVDDLLCECEAAIQLLGERRAALVTAAVTGQIDVRGLAISEAA